MIYGLAPNGNLAIGDTAIVRSISEYRHILYIQRRDLNITEAITLNGKLPATPADKAKLTVLQYERWGHLIPFDAVSLPKPEMTITYEGVFDKQDFTLPNYIKATSGSMTLEIEYLSASQNPKDMTLKINMPK